jgi:hypothetical protein
MKKFLLTWMIAAVPLASVTQETNLVHPPWHLVDLWWTPAVPVTCEWFSVDITIEGEVPTNLPLYISPLGGGEGCAINGVQCYGGLQTKPDGGDRVDQRIRSLGEPGFIFSRWGERSLDTVRMSSRGACQSSGHEGDFVGVRVREPWAAGAYTYILRGQDHEVREGRTNRWLGAFVYNHQTDRETYIGAIRIPGDGLVLGRELTSFVEIYGGPITPDRVPALTITFGNHRADGMPILMRQAVAYHDPKFPLRARATAVERSSVKVTVSPAPASGSRHYWLWQEKQ